jgi:DNA end-binding protein Ku
MRSIWSGAISFGLIYIPVRLYSASESKTLDFNLLRRGDQCRIRYARVCRETGEEVPYEDIVKGYEYSKGQYVVMEDEDFERAAPRKSKTIDIVNFVEAAEIDTKFLEKPYFLEPDPAAKKVYALLREALKKSQKVGVARFVLRTREHLALIKAEDNVLVLNQLRFADEIRQPDDLELPAEEDLGERELEMAVKLIDQLTEAWQPEQYKDTYTEDLLRIIQEKVEGREIQPAEDEPVPIEVTDLFAKLSESLEMAKDKSTRK